MAIRGTFANGHGLCDGAGQRIGLASASCRTVLALALVLGLSACGTETGGGSGSDTTASDGGGNVLDSGVATDAGLAKDTSTLDAGADAGLDDVMSTKPDGGTTGDAGGTTGDAGGTTGDAGGATCQITTTTGKAGGGSSPIAPCGSGFFCKANACSGAGVCAALPKMCASTYSPVCGCNGQTYSNPCNAFASGVNVAVTGECKTGKTCGVAGKSAPDQPGGFVPVGCATKQYCNGTCGDVGVCATKPTICPDNYAPVCGCDGKEYTTGCAANASGVAVDHKGKCKTTTPVACTVFSSSGAMPAPASCSAKQFCKLPTNQCSGQGVCADLPTGLACTNQYDPVCGCDGKTYGNACAAGLAGANVDSKGVCKPAPKGCCVTSKDCGVGALCVGGGGTSAGGVCKGMGNPTSGACWSDAQCVGGEVCVGAQVCPCKAQCFAADKAGTCQAPSKTSCTIGLGAPTVNCGAGNYCKLSQPNACSGGGACAAKPQMCGAIYGPVCGCDGKTYGNACSAGGAGQNVSSNGKCATP